MKYAALFLQALCFILLPLSLSAHETFTICGTGDSQALLQEIARVYEQSHPDITISVPDSIGSSGGIRLTATGQCSMGRVARELRPKEAQYNLTYLQFAVSPIVFIANPSVTKVHSLSTTQVIDIFSGKITNWAQLGDSDARLAIAKREHGDSSRTALERGIPALSRISSWAGKSVFSTPKTIETVEQFPGALAFAPIAMARKAAVRILPYNGLPPLEKHIRSGLYPFTVPLGLVWKGEISDTGKDILAFITGPKGRKILDSYGVLPSP